MKTTTFYHCDRCNSECFQIIITGSPKKFHHDDCEKADFKEVPVRYVEEVVREVKETECFSRKVRE